MRRWTIIGLVGIVLGVAGWLFLTPWIAMDGLREAAQSADRDELERRIDFPALRESVKTELLDQIRVETPTGDGLEGAVASIGNSFAEGFVQGTVDAVVTPDGMAAMLKTGSLVPGRESAAQEMDWQIQLLSFDTFRAYPEGQDREEHPALLFKRDGWSWKLVGLEIPDRDPAAQ